MPRYTTDPAFRYRLTWTHSHEWPQEPPQEPPESMTIGHLLAVLSAGVVLGILAWIFVVGLLTVAS